MSATYREGTTHVSGDLGTQILAVDPDGKYATVRVDASRLLRVVLPGSLDDAITKVQIEHLEVLREIRDLLEEQRDMLMKLV